MAHERTELLHRLLPSPTFRSSLLLRSPCFGKINSHTSSAPSDMALGTDAHDGDGYSNGDSPCVRVNVEESYDMIGIGFGPSNLALAIALHDKYTAENGTRRDPPRILFLERQETFGWHRGMLIPGAKMRNHTSDERTEISFIKDMAALRNPRSHFTFLNYLHTKGRLASFTNLGTFLPRRSEYEDYLQWCAEHFRHAVRYSSAAMEVSPVRNDVESSRAVQSFRVVAQDIRTGRLQNFRAPKVVIAPGGTPRMPKSLLKGDSRIFHSSAYMTTVKDMLPFQDKAYSLAVIGSGQSAAEIFIDLHSRYPKAKTTLILKGSALRPSDDSPFVNEIFDPDQVDLFFGACAEKREAALIRDKGTNYGVVRPELLDHIYEKMYTQRVKNPDPQTWQHRILPQHMVGGSWISDSDQIMLHLIGVRGNRNEPQDIAFDAVICATGYERNTFENLLWPLRDFRPVNCSSQSSVKRDYSLVFDEAKVDKTKCRIFLSGCNEATHGLSDTLLSVLATRAGEMVQTMFGECASETQ